MARKKVEVGGESDLIDRESPGHDIGQAETESGHGPRVTDYYENKEYVEAQKATDVGVADDKAEDAQSAANLVGQTDRGAIKRENFSRLASKRVTCVLERLAVLKNLANTSTYDWTQEQQDKIFTTIEQHLDEVNKAFCDAKNRKVRDKSQLRFEV